MRRLPRIAVAAILAVAAVVFLYAVLHLDGRRLNQSVNKHLHSTVDAAVDRSTLEPTSRATPRDVGDARLWGLAPKFNRVASRTRDHFVRGSLRGGRGKLQQSKVANKFPHAQRDAEEEEVEYTANATLARSNVETPRRAAVRRYLCACVGLLHVVMMTVLASRLKREWLSSSVLILLVGFAMGGALSALDYVFDPREFLYVNAARFDQHSFMTFIVPVIIYDAGYSMRHEGILRNLAVILALAVFGTMLSAALIGAGVWWAFAIVAPQLHTTTGTVFVALVFASALSATDTLAIISVFSSKYDLTKEPPLLYNLIFGESVLNDAVAIVLFNVFSDFISHPFTWSSGVAALGTFAGVFFGSVALGFVCGGINWLFFVVFPLKETPHAEVFTLIGFAAVSYYVAEYLHMSGIMTIFITARVMGMASARVLSAKSSTHVHFLFKTAALLADTYVFLFLGAAVWAYEHDWNPKVVAVTIAIVLASRAAVIFPIAFVSNHSRKKSEKITMPMQVFMWFAGLRGAVSFGLGVVFVEAVNEMHRRHMHEHKSMEIRVANARMLFSSVLGVVLFTLVVMGSMSGVVFRHLKLGQPQLP